MKKTFTLILLISLFLTSCTSVENRAENTLKEFSNDLSKITDSQKSSSYELSKLLNNALNNLRKNKSSELAELSDTKDKELFESLFDLETIGEYTTLREVLTNENLVLLKKIKDKMWIDKETKHSNSLFQINEDTFSFLNLNNKFDYKILDGNIICDNQNIFFELDNESLYIINENGDKREFQEAKDDETVLGRWKNTNTSGGKYNGMGIILKEDGKGIEYGYNWQPITYSVSGKKINTIKRYKNAWGDSDVDKNNYTILNNNRLRISLGATFARIRSKGPNDLNYIFNGDFENPNKKTIKVEYSDKSTNEIATSSKDWNKILDDYDDYIDEYIKYYKKAKNGDTSALQEYPKLMEKAETLQKSLDKASKDNSLSSEQISRLTKIQSKIINAIK